MRRPYDDTSVIVGVAIHRLRANFAPGYMLAKAGAMLLDLTPTTRERFELDLGKEEFERGRARLMQALDSVNDRWGRGVLEVTSGRAGEAPCDWRMKQDRKSQDYITSWEQMPKVKA